MKFSIITCTYNRAQYIGRCLDASCGQNYQKEAYEIIVVDNNSTDNTTTIIQQYISEHPNINIRYAKEIQQGLSFALNCGIETAQGEYIIYLDDDETIDKEYLQTLDTYLNQYPNVQLAGSRVVPVYETEKPKWLSHFTMRLITGAFDKGNEVKRLGTKDYPGTGHTIIKRELYGKFGKFNTELGRKGTSLMGAEDKDMCFRLISNNIECYYFPKLAIYHHIPANKLTSDFFHKLTYSIGKSERMRTQMESKGSYYKRLLLECVKWGASWILFFFYLLTLRPHKGWKLLQFRWNVSRGLLFG